MLHMRKDILVCNLKNILKFAYIYKTFNHSNPEMVQTIYVRKVSRNDIVIRSYIELHVRGISFNPLFIHDDKSNTVKQVKGPLSF